MALANAGWPEQQNIGAPVDPLCAFGERHHLCLGNTGYSCEVKAGEPLVRAQARLHTVPVDASGLALIDLMLQQGLQQPVPRPTPPCLTGRTGRRPTVLSSAGASR